MVFQFSYGRLYSSAKKFHMLLFFDYMNGNSYKPSSNIFFKIYLVVSAKDSVKFSRTYLI